MGFTKIQDADLVDKGVIGLPDTPGLSTAAMQAKFEETARSVIIPKHNALIDELEASTAAANIGATAPTGRSGSTTQEVIDDISGDLAEAEAALEVIVPEAHTHANKELLDTYTQTETDLADAVSKKHSHTNKSLLDTYNQSNSDLADAVTKKHSHTNKSLLDSYNQSNTDLTDAVSKKHSHANKDLLDTYNQTNTNIADAVTKKHSHSNKSLLDSYTQSNTDLSDAVTKKHSHANKSVLDKFSEIDGKPAYNGTALDEGDMKTSVYDSDSTVKNAGGIKEYVESQAYELPVASASTLGGVKQGSNVSIDENGVLSGAYENATASTAGLMSAADKGKLDSLTSDHYIDGDTLVFITTRQVVDGDTLIL